MLLSFVKLAGWQLSWVAISSVEIFIGGNIPGENFPGWEFSGGGLPGVVIFVGGWGIFRVGNHIYIVTTLFLRNLRGNYILITLLYSYVKTPYLTSRHLLVQNEQ